MEELTVFKFTKSILQDKNRIVFCYMEIFFVFNKLA